MNMKDILISTGIEGFGGYLIYSSGKIFSLKSEKYLKSRVNSYGYHHIDLWNEGKRHTKLVSRLVAQAFIPNPDNKPEVNHEDGNKDNNDISNLSWMTSKENKQHGLANGLMNLYGKKQVPVTAYDYKTGLALSQHSSMKEAAEHHGLNTGAVSRVINGEYKHTKGLTFTKTK